MVTTANGHGRNGLHISKLYAERDAGGDILWHADKRNATPLTETDADQLAAEINRYASTPAEVEGLIASTASAHGNMINEKTDANPKHDALGLLL
jgi:hypothetical protein